MEKTENEWFRFGLIGKNISYSFSRGYFAQKFEALNMQQHVYENFDLKEITEFPSLMKNNAEIKGLNVTIPYKELIIPYLDELRDSAKKIGAVNTIKVEDGKLIGFNTDAYGFEKSLAPYLKEHHKKALILGTGGASKAIAYVLTNLNIPFKFVSRTGRNNGYTYDDLDADILNEHKIIINCSPVGTFPDVTEKPAIPYTAIGNRHLLFDLIYNPKKTAFLLKGEEQGATVLNGLKMLELQAEKAWEIWNE
ncbi:shikimate dehydrogenase family protein [Maribacter aestuarii]|uniref:shikimate dehydrogenase family protein n=1 Tax=Maribacter aestuarii TaxID=1130723 RepID=UPI00248A9680|nr:shikimate dehydrogenase [Maribacter aestuarii]